VALIRPKSKTIAAFVVAPLAGCLALGLLIGIPFLILSDPAAFLLFVCAGALFSAFLAFPTVLVLGGPVFAWMQKRGLVLKRHYLAAGASTGFAVVFVIIAVGTALGPNFHLGNMLGGAFLLLSGVLVGGIGALTGWAIRRPDRDLLIPAS
jgi:hypothetical protein